MKRTPEHIIGEIAVLPNDGSDFMVTPEEMSSCHVRLWVERAMRGTDKPYDDNKFPSFLECMGHRLVTSE